MQQWNSALADTCRVMHYSPVLTARRLGSAALLLGLSACTQESNETSLSRPPSLTEPPSTSAPSFVSPTDPTSPPSSVSRTDPTSAPLTSLERPTSSSLPPVTPGGTVSYLSPPPMLALRPLGTMSFKPCCGAPAADVAIGDQGVVVNQSWLGHMTTIGFDRVNHNVPVDGEMYSITYGPGDVVYGLRQGNSIDDFAIVAVALRGDQRGTTVASAPLGIVAYTELPDGAFGHGATGIIDRARAVNTTVIPYVDAVGLPLGWPDADPTLYTTTDGEASVVVSSSELSWRLDLDAAPDAAATYNGPSPPAPSSDGLAVFWTHIGPNARPDLDFGEPTMPVVAALHPDGSVQWWSIPDGWNVVASDVWGTVLAHIEGGSIDVALADW
jgi:hypothetical protein